ncbi:hypothetical protein KIN20_003410 [Parelaphostrongylus tenuis]|uniref:SCP domain-containing protein n=1 Tax=Parelaphostrongylus tenuis TaxID=148309 RepID=A0AAD5MI79_PARTN|nr:hypothetical protein KIN20_003410 [Parelaphostrongylus tenuis]
MLQITLLTLCGTLFQLGHSADTWCPDSSMSIAFEQAAMDAHNDFRSLVARGLVQNGMYVGVNAPMAANMQSMNYDCNAEYAAYEHVKTCDKKPSPPEERPDSFNFLENMHILETNETSLNDSFIAQTAISTWANELKDTGIPLDMVFTREVSQNKMITNVTKMIWAKLWTIGCATQKCDRFYFTSCMYFYRANKLGKNIYNIGATCNECRGMVECKALKGLCPFTPFDPDE